MSSFVVEQPLWFFSLHKMPSIKYYDSEFNDSVFWAEWKNLFRDSIGSILDFFEFKTLFYIAPRADMSDKCRRYVADPIIGCFRACRCGAIAYREKMYRLYRCRCDGVGLKLWIYIGNLSTSLVCILVPCNFVQSRILTYFLAHFLSEFVISILIILQMRII